MNSAFTTLLPQTEDDILATTQRQAAAERANWQTAWTTALASAARTANTTSTAISTLGYRGILIGLANSTTDATLNLQLGILLPSALLTNIPLAAGVAFGVSSVLERGLAVSPDIQDRDSVVITGISWNCEQRRHRLPDQIRICVSHSSANSITYQVRYLLIP